MWEARPCLGNRRGIAERFGWGRRSDICNKYLGGSIGVICRRNQWHNWFRGVRRLRLNTLFFRSGGAMLGWHLERGGRWGLYNTPPVVFYTLILIRRVQCIVGIVWDYSDRGREWRVLCWYHRVGKNTVGGGCGAGGGRRGDNTFGASTYVLVFSEKNVPDVNYLHVYWLVNPVEI